MYMDQKGKTALVTGASSGIGLEIARVHASSGGDLVLVARRKERLEKIKADFESEYHVTVQIIVKDLCGPNACEEVYNETKVPIDYLINNAGFGLIGFYHETPWERNREMIELNVTALAGLTHFFLKDMVGRKSGKILNVSSIAAFLPGPLHATYYATKAFELSFSEAIANEVIDKNVTVSVLCPGPVKTEFGIVAGWKSVKGNRASRVSFASAEDTARIGYEGMLKGKNVIIPTFAGKLSVVLMRFIPRRALVWISRKIMEMATEK